MRVRRAFEVGGQGLGPPSRRGGFRPQPRTSPHSARGTRLSSPGCCVLKAGACTACGWVLPNRSSHRLACPPWKEGCLTPCRFAPRGQRLCVYWSFHCSNFALPAHSRPRHPLRLALPRIQACKAFPMRCSCFSLLCSQASCSRDTCCCASSTDQEAQW